MAYRFCTLSVGAWHRMCRLISYISEGVIHEKINKNLYTTICRVNL